MSFENTWQEIRDHSSKPDLTRFPDPCWCFLSFSSTHTFSIGFRSGTGMAIADAWFCAQWHIFVLLEDPNMACYKISSSCQVLIFLSVGIWSNPWCHVSEQDVQDLWQKIGPTTLKIQRSISFYTWGTFLSVWTKPYSKCLLPKSSFFVLFHLSIERLKSNLHYWNFKRDRFYGQMKPYTAKMDLGIWRDSVWRNGLWSLVRCSPNSSGIIGENSEQLSWKKEVSKSI